MKVISIVNRRGGVGKTATAHAIGSGLIKRGFRTLFIDLDSQCNLTYDMGASNTSLDAMDVMMDPKKSAGAILNTAQGDIIPADPALAGADALITDTGKEYRLREAIEPVKSLYDFCIIDTPPALGILTVNAMTAADGLIIPAQAEIHSLQGISLLNDTINAVKRYCNPKLHIIGILLTRYNGRSVLSVDMRENIQAAAAHLGTVVFGTPVRECVAIKEAQARQQNIFDYAPRSNAASDYSACIEDILKRKEL